MTRGPSSCSARCSSSAAAASTKPPITCPPSKPISTRTRSSSATRYHLRENAMDGFRVHEGDLEAEQALARRGVDQLSALLGELGEGRRNIVHLVGDVVHPRPAVGDEPADRGVVAECREELDAAISDPHRRGLDAL